MIDKLLNTMRQQSAFTDNNTAYPRLGIVTSYNPKKHTVRVKIQPENEENPELSLSGELPVLSSFVGDNWGLVAAPAIGDLVLVIFQEASYNTGFVVGTIWGLKKNSPETPSEEFWLVHKSGSFLKFKNNGDIEINSSAKCTVHGNTVDVTANQINLGESNLKKLMTEDIINIFNSHVHTNGNGGANTGIPTTSFNISQATSKVKGE